MNISNSTIRVYTPGRELVMQVKVADAARATVQDLICTVAAAAELPEASLRLVYKNATLKGTRTIKAYGITNLCAICVHVTPAELLNPICSNRLPSTTPVPLRTAAALRAPAMRVLARKGLPGGESDAVEWVDRAISDNGLPEQSATESPPEQLESALTSDQPDLPDIVADQD